MPNGRNAERIFGRNADSYCPISGGMPKTRGSRNESVSWQKHQVPLIVFVNVYTSRKFWGMSMTKSIT